MEIISRVKCKKNVSVREAKQTAHQEYLTICHLLPLACTASLLPITATEHHSERFSWRLLAEYPASSRQVCLRHLTGISWKQTTNCIR